MRSGIITSALFVLLAVAQAGVCEDTISDGLTLTMPSQGATNWFATFKAMVEKISAHDHTGGGNGNKISSDALEDNIIDEDTLRISNNAYIRARNNAGSGDVNILKVTTSDGLSIAPATTFESSVTLSSPLPVASGGTGSATASDARTALGINLPLSVSDGGTGSTTASEARTALGITYPISVSNGGTGSTTASEARAALGVSYPISVSNGGTGSTTASAARSALGLSLPIPVASGGTGSTTATDARSAISAAKSGANSDITSITSATTYSYAGSVSLLCDSDLNGSDHVKIGGSTASSQWDISNSGKITPPSSLTNSSYQGFPGTARRSIDPTVATNQQLGEMLNTLVRDMAEIGYIPCSANCSGL